MHQAVLFYEQEQQQNQVSYYFRKAKVLELGQGYLDIFSDKTKGWYVRGLQELYDVLYDRIITSEIHPFMKRKVSRMRIKLIITKYFEFMIINLS